MIIIQRTAAEFRALELQLDSAVRLAQLADNLGDKEAVTLHALEAVRLHDQMVRSVVVDGQTA